MILLNTNMISKAFGVTPLFRMVSLSIGEGDRLGLIGPNGSGKSTLLRILAGHIPPDSGEVVVRKGARLVYVPQDSAFEPGETPRSVMRRALELAGVPEAEWPGREAEAMGRAGFRNFDADAATLSGGWGKRLSIAQAMVQNPTILLLDEPTNHLDLVGIEWLEKALEAAPFACVMISHDRYLLENVPTSMAELNRIYPDNIFFSPGNYSAFLEQKAEFLHAQAKRQSALENRVRTEMEWLRRGPKARTTKAKARIDNAGNLIAELSDLRSRTRTATTDIDFLASGRKTRRLVHLEGVDFGFEEKPLFEGLTFTITSGMRVGLVGANGSGKTTLLQLLRGDLAPQRGEIHRAEGLRIVYFDQRRRLNPDLTLRRTLAPDTDSVIYRGRVIHIASWAARFLFANEQLDQPVSKLSGGERARVLIANLMLEPADLLLLDEPTNDLDIPTLEILEESLLEFEGALVLVTHDRYLLDRVASVVLGLAEGKAEAFADYSQWAAEQRSAAKPPKPKSTGVPAGPPADAPSPKKKLSYLESREYESIGQRIPALEEELNRKRVALQDALHDAALKGPRLLHEMYREIEASQEEIDALYERWMELEEKTR
ncbi:MAG TPA: ABC-F family ATP-binding cassette domain-containing protein [Bryobacteraceae bacterium]|nr:ABC-F family ATP-binding cassette domain-containing protein [Bryobacteraceae bacterium]